MGYEAAKNHRLGSGRRPGGRNTQRGRVTARKKEWSGEPLKKGVEKSEGRSVEREALSIHQRKQGRAERNRVRLRTEGKAWITG